MLLNQKLKEYKQEFHRFSIDDSLVNFKQKKVVFINDSMCFQKQEVKLILKETLFFEKEFGINSLCLVKGTVKLKYRDKIVNTPILIKNCSFVENKITQTLNFTEEEIDFELNPFLQFYLDEYLNLSENNETKNYLQLLKINFKDTISENELYIGNFHPHRHRFLNELSNLLISEKFSLPLKHVFGELTSDYQIEKLSNNSLYYCDEDQHKVNETIEIESLILQGPPGTGKSQTITNTLFKFLENQKTILVVSEKKAALTIIQSKLKEQKLDLISILTNASDNSSDIYSNLKETWIQFENYAKENQDWIKNDSDKENLKRITLAFQKEGIIGGISLKEFFSENNILTLNLKNSFLQNTPSILEFKLNEHNLRQLSESNFKILKFVKYNFIQLSSVEINSNLKSNFEGIQKLKKTFQFVNFSDLDSLIKVAITYQNFNSTIYKKYGTLLTKNTKKFIALRKKWNQLNNQISALEIHENHWLKKPSSAEISLLKSQASSTKIIDKIRWRNRWRKWTRTPKLNAIEQLEIYQKSMELNVEIATVKNQLIELDITNTNEIETIYSLIQTTDLEKWNIYLKVDKNQLNDILNSHSILKNLQLELSKFLDLKPETFTDELLENLLANFDELLDLKIHLKNISKNTFENLKQVANFQEWKNAVYNTTWKNFTVENPEFRNFSFLELFRLCKKIIEKEKRDSPHLATKIIEIQVRKFKDFHELINTPNSKLKENQKREKQELKIGKSILVKEFSKKRNHLSLRQLMESEAEKWMAILKPIWLTNPTKLAITFPMKCELFDLVIFDEAGRIPLVHSLGALQRAKKILVAGDPQQMGPSNYFSELSNLEEDLLHQATFYLKNVFLSNHYRSKNKALIEFSNTHFYENKLKVFQDFSSINEHPIHFNFLKNGVYSDGVNEFEAIRVASEINRIINCLDKIGIVAFSESQLNLIFNKLQASTQERLIERVENDSAFFKTLEQVQGDECDTLLISFGYGKNSEGKFEMRFGPINQQNGKKRLNVLFTRARKRIDFFASVKASDFPISENESIRLLWLWFCFVEKIQTQKAKQNTTNEIDFKQQVYDSKSSLELLNKIAVYEERGWVFSF